MQKHTDLVSWSLAECWKEPCCVLAVLQWLQNMVVHRTCMQCVYILGYDDFTAALYGLVYSSLCIVTSLVIVTVGGYCRSAKIG